MSKEKRGAVSANTSMDLGLGIVAVIIILGGLILIAVLLGQRQASPAPAPIALTVAMTQAETATPLKRATLPPTFTPTATFTPAPTSTPRDTATPYASKTPPPMVQNTPVMSSGPYAIAYVNGRDIYTIDPIQPRTNTLLITNGSDPLWSPDGTWIAYNRYFGATDSVELMVAKADGHDEKQLTQGGIQNFSYRWLPNSQGLMFISKVTVKDNGDYLTPPRLYLAHLDGRAPQQIGKDPLPRDRYMDYDISPDSASVLYVSSVSSDLMQVSVATNAEQALARADSGYLVTDFIWSPDGTKVAYVMGTPGGTPALYTFSKADGITRIDTGMDSVPTLIDVFGWSTDSSIVYWTSLSPMSTQLLATEPDGERLISHFKSALRSGQPVIGSPRITMFSGMRNGIPLWVTGVCSADGEMTTSFVRFYFAIPQPDQTFHQFTNAFTRTACSFSSAGRSFWDIAPNGEWLVYAISDEGTEDAGLHIAGTDGMPDHIILAGSGFYSPVWRKQP